jgi:hypothetical protein
LALIFPSPSQLQCAPNNDDSATSTPKLPHVVTKHFPFILLFTPAPTSILVQQFSSRLPAAITQSKTLPLDPKITSRVPGDTRNQQAASRVIQHIAYYYFPYIEDLPS